jgi:oligoendopeptidase F
MAKTFYPSTLAETASTFAEALMARTLLSDPNLSPNEKKSLLVTELNRSLVFLLDIPFRYDFEVAFHNEKKTKHVSAQRASELMLAAQKFWLGDTIADSELDPCFWMSKMHFYMPSALFYNFPYMVGFLLSQHLTDSFVKDPKKFTPIYEQFLIETGDHTVEEVITNTFNRDAHKADFWLEALNRTEALFGELKKL